MKKKIKKWIKNIIRNKIQATNEYNIDKEWKDDSIIRVK